MQQEASQDQYLRLVLGQTVTDFNMGSCGKMFLYFCIEFVGLFWENLKVNFLQNCEMNFIIFDDIKGNFARLALSYMTCQFTSRPLTLDYQCRIIWTGTS